MKIRNLIFNSEYGNKYFYSFRKKQLLSLPPVLHSILSLDRNRGDRELSIAEIENTLPSEDELTNKNEVVYYLKKFHFLKNHGLIDESDFSFKHELRLTEGDVRENIANVNMISFEVTEECNLKCEYCAFGKFYQKEFDREKSTLNFDDAKALIEYFKEFWLSDNNYSSKQSVAIGFYGGEPLVNIELIQRIVTYTKEIEKNNSKLSFYYTMTTNGLLLDKYAKYLVDNNFKLMISLDGDESANEHRIRHDGGGSHKRIVDNIIYVRNKYMTFYENNISFNSVLHNKNSVESVLKYFNKTFDKTPLISSLSVDGINKTNESEFWKTYKNQYESTSQVENLQKYESELFINISSVLGYADFLLKFVNSTFNDYSSFFNEEDRALFPTGTCLPFSRRVFLSSKGRILPCERIAHINTIGFVKNGVANISLNEVVEKYNNLYDKIEKSCLECVNIINCNCCMLKGEKSIHDEDFVCSEMKTEEFIHDKFIRNVSYFENNPRMFSKILKKVVLK